jgi:tetratricopeptide (TPR) repeat protein
VTGPVVNAAARLEAGAEPGEVLVGVTTRALVTTSVSLGRRREIEAKGFERGLAAFPVEGLSTRSVRRTIPFVGRSHELTMLNESLARVVATERPALVTLVGEPGVGKTRLADEFTACLDDEVVVLAGRSGGYGDSATFAPVAAVIRDAAGIVESDHDIESVEKLRALAGAVVGPDEVDDLVFKLGLPLNLTQHPEESVFVESVRSGFLTLVGGLSDTAPLVIVFEDGHDLPPAMLDLIERLTARGMHAAARILVTFLARPELWDDRPGWGAAAGNALTLRLEPLPADDAVDLVRQAGGGAIPELEAQAIAARTGGNPFFIVETTGMLLDEDPGKRAGSALPPTVQATVAARLDALPTATRELARRVSVFLHPFTLDDIAMVAQVERSDLHVLEDAEFLVVERESTTPHWRFRNGTVRDVTYASLPKRERLRLHVQVADSLEGEGLKGFAADHLELAAAASLDLDPVDRTLPERAADALSAAGDRARRRLESREAVDRYQRALALAPEADWGVREARCLAGAGEARYWLGEYAEARRDLERAVEIGEAHSDHWTLAHALRFLGDIAINVQADLDEAERIFGRSLGAAEALGEPWAVERTLLFAGWVPWTRNQHEEAHAIWERALAMAEEHEDRWAQVRALTNLSINCGDLDGPAAAEELIGRAEALAREMGDRFSLAVATVQHGRIHEDAGRLEEAIPCFDQGIAIFEELGARWEFADALAERGITYRELNRLDEAEADLRRATRISDELGERQLAGWTWRALAKVAEKRGDQAAAEERWRRAEEGEARRPR